MKIFRTYSLTRYGEWNEPTDQLILNVQVIEEKDGEYVSIGFKSRPCPDLLAAHMLKGKCHNHHVDFKSPYVYRNMLRKE